MSKAQAHLRYFQSAFTLLELLVVIAIISIVVGMVTLTPGNRQVELLEKETQRFLSLLELAQTEAIIQSRQLAVGFYDQGYAFFEQPLPHLSQSSSDCDSSSFSLDDDSDSGAQEKCPETSTEQPAWRLKTKDDVLRQRTLPEAWEPQLELEGIEVILPEQEKLKAQVFVLSSSEMTPFGYKIKYPSVGTATITVDAVGKTEHSYEYEDK